MTIGEVLKNIRLRHKRTLKEQSQILGVSINTVYRWEHNIALPRKTALKKLATSFGMSADQLIQKSWIEDVNFSDGMNYENDVTEQQMLKLFRKLSSPEKCRVMGFLERSCMEDEEDDDLDTFLILSPNIAD